MGKKRTMADHLMSVGEESDPRAWYSLRNKTLEWQMRSSLANSRKLVAGSCVLTRREIMAPCVCVCVCVCGRHLYYIPTLAISAMSGYILCIARTFRSPCNKLGVLFEWRKGRMEIYKKEQRAKEKKMSIPRCYLRVDCAAESHLIQPGGMTSFKGSVSIVAGSRMRKMTILLEDIFLLLIADIHIYIYIYI